MRAPLLGRMAAFAAAAALSCGAALAQSPADSPAGLWKTIDETTKQPKALVRIVENDGVLTGRIERILPPGKPDAKCEACDDERRDQPVQGMAILTGLRRQGEQWEGGRILDPTNGKNYQARIKLIEGGRKLELRGFIGTPMLGRTQVWVREQ